MEAFEPPIHIFDNHNDQNPKINQSVWVTIGANSASEYTRRFEPECQINDPCTVGRSERTINTHLGLIRENAFFGFHHWAAENRL